MSTEGPFKLLPDGSISGPIVLLTVPGMPAGTVVVNVELLNRLFKIGRDLGRAEEIALRKRAKDRIANVIGDLELDDEPPPDFEALRKKLP